MFSENVSSSFNTKYSCSAGSYPSLFKYYSGYVLSDSVGFNWKIDICLYCTCVCWFCKSVPYLCMLILLVSAILMCVDSPGLCHIYVCWFSWSLLYLCVSWFTGLCPVCVSVEYAGLCCTCVCVMSVNCAGVCHTCVCVCVCVCVCWLCGWVPYLGVC